MNRIAKFALMFAAGVVLAGCSNSKDKLAWEDPFFPADHVTPASKLMSDRQAANGAAADGMLFDIHFDGGELNSLGQQKLDLMVKGTRPSTSLKVYLNMPADAETTPARESAVVAALGAAGLASDRYTVAVGPNPGVLMPAAAGINALSAAGEEGGTEVDASYGLRSAPK